METDGNIYYGPSEEEIEDTLKANEDKAKERASAEFPVPDDIEKSLDDINERLSKLHKNQALNEQEQHLAGLYDRLFDQQADIESRELHAQKAWLEGLLSSIVEKPQEIKSSEKKHVMPQRDMTALEDEFDDRLDKSEPWDKFFLRETGHEYSNTVVEG